jgi:hypothetical protein
MTEHELNQMGLRDLQNRFHEVVGEETRCPNKTFLVRRILAALAAQDAGANDSVSTAANESAPANQDTDASSTSEQPAIEASEPPASEHLPAEQPAVEAAVAAPPAAEPTAVQSLVEESPAAEQPALEDAHPEPEEEAFAMVIEPAPITEAIPPRFALAEDETLPHDKLPPAAPASAVDDRPASNAIEGAPAQLAPSTSEPAAALSSTQPARGRRGRFRDMTVDQLQALYLSTVGRPSGSTDRRYLEWKIREAEKGRITIGPREPRAAETEARDDLRVLPLRLDGAAVDALDATWKSHGMKSRMDFFRRALGHYLAHLGASGDALHFASQPAE